MITKRCVTSWSIVAWLLATTTAAVAADWTHWRGPEQNGVSRDKNLISDWSLEPRENVLWVSDIGGRATPIVSQGKVYLNCRTHHDVTDPEEKVHAREQVVCWDAETGEILWRDEFNVFQTDIPAPRVGWAPMAADPETGNVYVHSVSGLFRCYSADGERLWEYSLFEDFGKIAGYGGRTQAPIIDEDRVIVSFMAMNWGDTKSPPPKQTYYAFDKRDGRLLWVSAPGGAPQDTNYSYPVVNVIDGVRQLIGGNSDGGIYAIHARTGEPLWGFQMSKRGLNAAPVVDGDYVYISHGEDNIDNNEFGSIQCIDATGRGDITQTHSVWRVDGIKAGYAGLLVKDGILYVVADTGTLYAFDSQNGEQLWTYNMGTVGKGSPVWADGKIYVMEVNGNVHIIEPSREGAKQLSHVELDATKRVGTDEIYASPAIADGRIFLVTRDRTICLGNEDREPESAPIPPMDPERDPTGEPAIAHLVPYEVALDAGESSNYELRVYDTNGRHLETVEPELQVAEGLEQSTVDGSQFSTSPEAPTQAGNLAASYGDLTSQARVRVFSKLPWSWDFSGFEGTEVPPTWIRAFLKLKPAELDGEPVMVANPGPGRPSTYIWLGPSDMTNYAMQADLLMKEETRKLPYAGITVNRYNLIVKGNTLKLTIQSWAPHLRMAKELRFRSDPDVWYTVKMRVDIDDEGAHVKGKVWPRDEEEPEQWTIQADDPHPNRQGSPGLYLYSLAPTYYDNIIVTEDE